VDVTVVGSGPNGLAAAVICARAGLSVQVFEAQPTLGGGARTLADPEFSGVAHDNLFGRASARPGVAVSGGVRSACAWGDAEGAEVAYANPLTGRPAAVGYHDLDRTCAELTDGESWRHLLVRWLNATTPLLRLLLGDKRSIPHRLDSALRVARRLLSRARLRGATLSGVDARALFTGVCRTHDFANAVAGVRRRGTDAGHVGSYRRLADTGRRQPSHPRRMIADLRAHGGTVSSGEDITEPPSGVVLYDTAPPRCCPYIVTDCRAICKGAAALPFRSGCGEDRFRAVGRDSME